MATSFFLQARSLPFCAISRAGHYDVVAMIGYGERRRRGAPYLKRRRVSVSPRLRPSDDALAGALMASRVV